MTNFSITQPASHITTTSVKLNGDITITGNKISYYFQYVMAPNILTDSDKNIAYMESTNLIESSPASVILFIDRLSPGTTYNYRLVSYYDGVVSYGTIQQFTTLGVFNQFSPGIIKPIVYTNDVSSVFFNAATLNGVVLVHGYLTHCYFKYGIIANCELWTQSIEVSTTEKTYVSIDVQNLLPNTTYYYKLVCNNQHGNFTGTTYSFTTPVLVVSQLSTDLNPSSATLNGTIIAPITYKNVETTYYFEYGKNNKYDKSTYGISNLQHQIDISSPISGLVSNIDSETTYHCRMVGTNRLGTAYGQDIIFVTPKMVSINANDITVTPTTALLYSVIFSEGKDTVYYFQYGENINTYQFSTEEQVLNSTEAIKIPLTLTNLKPDTKYYVRCVGKKNDAIFYSEQITFSTAKLISITSITSNATEATIKGVIIPLTNNTSYCFKYGIEEYNLTSELKANSSTTPFSFECKLIGLIPSTTYEGKMVAEINNMEYFSDNQLIITKILATTLVGNAVSATSVVLSGQIDSYDVSTNYNFQYGPTIDYGQTTISGTCKSPNLTTIYELLDSLIPNSTYHYRVVAKQNEITSYGEDKSLMTSTALSTETAIPGATTVILKGKIYTNNISTNTYFQYGTTTGYGTTTSGIDVSNSDSQIIETTVTDMLANTTYYYRFVGTNSFGTTYGNGKNFTTLALIITGDCSSISATKCTFTGTFNGNGVSTLYNFQYGLTTSYGFNTPAQTSSATNAISITNDVTGLTALNTYNYRTVCTQNGITIYGQNKTFTTLPILTLLPVANITETSVTLKGELRADGVSTTYNFQCGIDTNYSYTSTTQTGTSDDMEVITCIRTGLVAGTTYHYRLKGTRCGITIYSNDLTFTTQNAYIPPVVIVSPYVPSTIPNSSIGNTDLNNPSGIEVNTQPVPTTTIGEIVVVATTGSTSGLAIDNPVDTMKITLHGSILATNTDVDYYFDYGLTTQYGKSTPLATKIKAAFTASGVSDVWATITKLQRETTYHYKLVCKIGAKIYYGSDRSFFTTFRTSEPTTTPTYSVTALNAVSVTSTTATLIGAMTSSILYSEWASSSAWFAYGINSINKQSAIFLPSNDVSCNISSLIPSTTYKYQLCFYGKVSNTLTFTTLESTIVPSATLLPITNISSNSATLRASVNPYNKTVKCHFEYSSSSTATGVEQYYSSKTSVKTLSGSTSQIVSAELSSLSSNQRIFYIFRCYYSNTVYNVLRGNFYTSATSTVTNKTVSNTTVVTVPFNSKNQVIFSGLRATRIHPTLAWCEGYVKIPTGATMSVTCMFKRVGNYTVSSMGSDTVTSIDSYVSWPVMNLLPNTSYEFYLESNTYFLDGQAISSKTTFTTTIS